MLTGIILIVHHSLTRLEYSEKIGDDDKQEASFALRLKTLAESFLQTLKAA